MKNTPVKAVLWDMDGTLVNTAELHYQAHITTLKKHSYDLPRETYTILFGMDDHLIMRQVAPHMEENAFQAMVMEKNARYRQLAAAEALPPLPGVRHWLGTFQKWGLRQVVVSTNFAENIETLTRSLGLTPYFETLLSTISMHLPGKPAPDGFLKAAEMLGLSAAQCLVIEDAPAGIASAKAAGMKCLAVGTSNPLENLQAADLITPTLDELTEDQVVHLLKK
ncbi:MAG: HAD family phosphatase [Anaerolineaceae bacterium]|nr:HAD family phosphatase [Anaerolineaceae bacterium]